MHRITPFLMFEERRAEEAVRFYVATFPGAELLELVPHPADPPGSAGLLRGRWRVAGQEFLAFDSPAPHGFGFTPSVSFFVELAGREEFEAVAARLAEGGTWLMPPGEYGFSARFGWVSDRFGVSWQLNLATG